MTQQGTSFARSMGLRCLVAALALSALAPLSNAQTEMPSTRLSSAPLVTPTAALAYYNGFPNPTQHTPGETPWTNPPPELTVLARGLGADLVRAGQLSGALYAERVAEYVRNNIDVEFRYGLGKGARGAVLDQSGTPFDQAHLMRELLKIANVSASYKVGTITLNAQQFGQWTGLVTGLTEATPPALPSFTVNAAAACQFLADGGIPATVNSASSCSGLSGTLTSVTLGHIWLDVGGKVHDPAFKRYNLRAGIDLAQRMGCGTDATPTCGNLLTTSAVTGATTATLGGAATLTNVQEAAINTRLQGFATSLQGYVLPNRPDVDLEDLIGGRLPDDTYVVDPAATLPYTLTAQLTWGGNIPDQYRTRVRLHYRVIDPLLFADELAGRRTYFQSNTPLPGTTDNPLFLVIDEFVFTCPRVEPFIPAPREFETEVNHPYAANGGAYADETRGWLTGGRQLVGNQVLIFSTGNTGAGLPRHFTEYQNAIPAPPAGTFDPVSGLPIVFGDAANFIAAARLLYQESLGVRLLEGVSKTRVTQHHTIGMTFDNSGPIPGTIVRLNSGGTAFFSIESKLSVTSRSNDATARTAAFSALATVGAAIEGSVMQQAQDSWIPVTTGSIFSLANRKRIAFIDATPTNLPAVLPLLSNHNNSSLQVAAGQGYGFILPRNGDPGSFQITGGFYFTVATPLVAARADSIAYLIGADIKGGGGQPGAEDPTKAVQDTVSGRGLRRRDGAAVNLSSGQFVLEADPDIVTGSGEFPYSLPFRRTYVSSNSFTEQKLFDLLASNPYNGSDDKSFGRLGGGWTHNYQITADLSNDGNVGLGADRGADALAAIVGFYGIYDLARTATFQRRLTAPFVGNWTTDRWLTNVANISRQLTKESFVRLPNGAFMPPRGSAAQLSQESSRVGPLCAEDCTQASNGVPIYEAGTTYNYDSIRLNYTLDDGSVIRFIPSDYAKLFRIANQIALPNFTADTWTFPTGVRVKFETSLVFDSRFVTTKRFLTSVSNNLGRSLTFTAKGVIPQIPFQLDPPFGGQPATLLNEVRDESGRKVRFERKCLDRAFVAPGDSTFGDGPFACNTFEVITPDNARTVYSYEITPGSPQGALFPRSPYRLRRWFTPDDLTTPFLTIDYDELYRVRALVDKNLFTTEYRLTGFDEHRRRGEIRDPLGAMTTQYFNDDDRVLQTIDPLGRVTSNTYDAAGRLASTTLPENDKILYSYDARSNQLQTTRKARPGSGLSDVVTSATYPATCSAAASCNSPTTTTDALGQVTSYTYNTAGQLLTVSSPSVPLAGSTATPMRTLCYSSFPAAGNTSVSLLTGTIVKTTASKNRVTAYAYNAANKLVLESVTVDPATTLNPPAAGSASCTTSTKSGALNLKNTFSYDSVGDFNNLDGPLPGTDDAAIFRFDIMRRLERVTAPLGRVTRFEYLPDGSLSKTHRARVLNPVDGVSEHWLTDVRSYTPTGELASVTDPDGNAVRLFYDATGRQTLQVDPEGRSESVVFDLAGQVRCTWQGMSGTTPATNCDWDPASYASNGNDGRLRNAAFSYTQNGQLRSVQDAKGNITDYVYDGLDRQMFALFPDPANGTRCSVTTPITALSMPTCSGAQTYEKFTFDANGKRLTLRTRRGDTVTWTYDALGRTRTRKAGTLPTVTSDYNLLGELLSANSTASGSIPAQSTSYDYDDGGRKLYEQNLINGQQLRTSFQYDAAGQRTRLTWPDGYFVSYEYDAKGHMTTAWEGAVGSTKLASYGYDLFSNRKSVEFAGQASNRMEYDYELDGDLDLLRHVLGSVNVVFDYGRNRVGQIKRIDVNDAFHQPSPANGSTAVVPDRLNRNGSVGGQTSTYDDGGNLLTWFPPGGKQTYTYDADGRLITAAVGGSATATISYGYDAQGRRNAKTVGGASTYFLLDGREEIAEYSSTGSVLRRYIPGQLVDDRIAAVEGGALTNPPKTYFHVNHLGSVIAMTDAAGNATGCAAGTNCQRLSYDEFGLLGAGSVATGQPFRYTGRRFDEETGLYYYRTRHYAPQLGRFLQTDTIGYGDDLNLYVYTGNDPVNFTDPDGTCPPYNRTTGCKPAQIFVEGQATGAIGSTLLYYRFKTTPIAKRLLTEFLFGSGETDEFFDGDTPETKELLKNPYIKEIVRGTIRRMAQSQGGVIRSGTYYVDKDLPAYDGFDALRDIVTEIDIGTVVGTFTNGLVVIADQDGLTFLGRNRTTLTSFACGNLCGVRGIVDPTEGKFRTKTQLFRFTLPIPNELRPKGADDF